MVRGCDTLIVAKGKKSVRFESVQDANDEDMAAVILGRSGTLRAPAFRVGTTFVVGFHAEEYTALFG